MAEASILGNSRSGSDEKACRPTRRIIRLSTVAKTGRRIKISVKCILFSNHYRCAIADFKSAYRNDDIAWYKAAGNRNFSRAAWAGSDFGFHRFIFNDFVDV